MSELQLGLLAIGAGVIASVFFYNKWQERQYRRKADSGLAPSREDVLLGEGGPRDRDPAGSPDRVEPLLGPLDTEPAEGVASAAHTSGPVLSEHVDLVVPIERAEEVSGGEALQAVAETFQYRSRFARWEGFDETTQSWEALRPDQEYSMLRAGLQLSDRRGAASVEEIAAFGAAVERTATALGALANVPEAESAAARAAELDQFCSDVDIRVAVHLVTGQTPFPDDQMREFADTAGFEFDSENGSFRRHDRTGRILCTLERAEPSSDRTGGAGAAVAPGLTLEFDVPRSANDDFDQFRYLAERLARRIGGRIVDDNGQALGSAAFDAIRDRIKNVHRNMEARGIDPAGGLALRLFS
jgi:hypothetical protein